MQSEIGYVILGGGFLLGIYMAYGGLRKYLFLQKVTNTPTSKVRSAAAGLVELYGKITGTEDTRSPITGRKCAFWTVSAQYFKTGKGGGWIAFHTTCSSKRFLLEDETGGMLVDPAGATFQIPYDHHFRDLVYPTDESLPQDKQIRKRMMEFIDARGEEFKKNLQVYAHLEPVLVEVYKGDGGNAYVMGSAEPLQGAQSAVAHENLIVRKGEEGILYISETSEKKVLAEEGFGAYASIALGMVVSLFCLWLLLL